MWTQTFQLIPLMGRRAICVRMCVCWKTINITARSFLEVPTPLPCKWIHFCDTQTCRLSSGAFVCTVRVLECWAVSRGVSRFLCSPAAARLSRARRHCRKTSWPVCSFTPAVPGNHSPIPWESTSDPPLVILHATGWEILRLLAPFTSLSWQGGNLILTRSTGHGITNSACWLRDTASALKIESAQFPGWNNTNPQHSLAYSPSCVKEPQMIFL